MEITLEAIISLIGLIAGGTGLTGFLFWRQHKRKEEAEAKLAEAEAKLKEAEVRKAEIEANKEQQDYYQQLAKDLAEDREDRKRQNDELRAERDHYKNERNEYRDMLAQRDEEFRKFRIKTEEDLDALRRNQARQGRMIEAMRPFMCGDLRCQSRQRVTTLDAEALEHTIHINENHDAGIEPFNEGL
jgi:chromosome segregation ATPase